MGIMKFSTGLGIALLLLAIALYSFAQVTRLATGLIAVFACAFFGWTLIKHFGIWGGKGRE